MIGLGDRFEGGRPRRFGQRPRHPRPVIHEREAPWHSVWTHSGLRQRAGQEAWGGLQSHHLLARSPRRHVYVRGHPLFMGAMRCGTCGLMETSLSPLRRAEQECRCGEASAAFVSRAIRHSLRVYGQYRIGRALVGP